MIEIYTDGACSGNPGSGGWAAIVIGNGPKRALHGKESVTTTNNRMELLAVIKGLEDVPEGIDVTIFSDSKYVVDTMMRNWKRKANNDLWSRLDAEVAKRNVLWEWVRGHQGNKFNEEADTLAFSESQGKSLTHLNKSGKTQMVDVGDKIETQRLAIARGSVLMNRETLVLIKSNSIEKGDVLSVAKVAGVMSAKKTVDLIPLCHAIKLDQVSLEMELNEQKNAVDIIATAKTTAKTGVEMEALTAVSVAALTIYDMCKAVDRKMRIDGVRLIKKTGGKSGDFLNED